VKAFLMHPGQDFELEQDPPPWSADLARDLELGALLNAMAGGDKFLFDVAQRALLRGLTDPAAIRYRQDILADCLTSPTVVREMYNLAVTVVEGERKVFFGLFFRDSPDVILHRSVQVLEFFTGHLRTLRKLADEHAGNFHSAGVTRLFGMLTEELSDEYFTEIDRHLATLKFRRGVLISAGLGTGNKGIRYVLRKPREQGWLERLSPGERDGYSFAIADRDENGMRAVADLEGHGTKLVANALAQSCDHILSFFRLLRAELAFYIGCLNLHGLLTGMGQPVRYPDPRPGGEPALSAQGLYDPALALQTRGRVVANDLQADGKSLIMITGANQGGKSTFLRSLGLAQLMMQCGMFTCAQSYQADVSQRVFAHYKREEDASMKSGKLDEELARMSGIVDRITPGSLLLCNESFASTNEREGSEIAGQIVRALLDRGIKVVFVTHMFDLAQRFHQQNLDGVLFLRAGRQADGGRTFRISAANPLPTSHGGDVYQRIFAADLDHSAALG